MFQTFAVTSRPADGPPRLAALRAAIEQAGLTGFLVPRADAHQGEYVAPHDQRLAWLTGFTGSAGFAAVLPEVAGVFIDGRYRVQVRAQVDLAHFTPVNWPQTKLAAWLIGQLPRGGRVGFDPWLHTAGEIEALKKSLEDTGITLRPGTNFVDSIWPDQPGAPMGRAFVHPDAVAGEPAADKRARLAAELAKAGQRAAVLTLPDSICWLLNIRGADVPRNPIVQGFAVLHQSARRDVHQDGAQIGGVTRPLDQSQLLQPADRHRGGGRADPFVGGQLRHPDGAAVQQGQQDGQLRQRQIGTGFGVLGDLDASAHHVEQLGEDLLQVSCKVRHLRLRRRHSSIV